MQSERRERKKKTYRGREGTWRGRENREIGEDGENWEKMAEGRRKKKFGRENVEGNMGKREARGEETVPREKILRGIPFCVEMEENE